MKRIAFVNTDTDGLCRSIRACYGKCGFISFLIDTGQGITGVIEYEEDNVLNIDSDECAKSILSGCYKFGVATLLRPKGATMTSVIEIEDE